MFGIKETKAQFNNLKEEISKMSISEGKPSKASAFVGFFQNTKYAVKLIFLEKEIITFAILQLIVIGLGYYLWVQMLDWIPEEVWRSTKDSSNGSVADIVLILWSFVCVGLVTFPLGLFSACMGAAHFLHSQGKESTIAGCFRIVLPRSWPLWLFSWIDGWWTVNQILERLPKKNDKTPRSKKILKEALYQAWKLATLGILPALVIGRSIKEACTDSLGLLKNRFVPLIKLRIGYSTICWIFGIACYISVIFIFPFIKTNMRSEFDVYSFYFLAGVPLLIALAFIQLIFRPIYIISACRIYSDYVKEKEIAVSLPDKTPKVISVLVVFSILCIILAIVYIFRNELGIIKLLSVPYK